MIANMSFLKIRLLCINFVSGMTLVLFLIISVKFQLKLMSAIFLPVMISYSSSSIPVHFLCLNYQFSLWWWMRWMRRHETKTKTKAIFCLSGYWNVKTREEYSWTKELSSVWQRQQTYLLLSPNETLMSLPCIDSNDIFEIPLSYTEQAKNYYSANWLNNKQIVVWHTFKNKEIAYNIVSVSRTFSFRCSFAHR